MCDHLSLEGVKWFQTATSLNTTNDEKMEALEQLLKRDLPRELRDQLRIIFNEICPLEAIEYRKDVAA